MAKHETTTRATTAKTIHIGFIPRDFEVRAIAQRYTAIRKLNITRWWHDLTEAIEIVFPTLVYERYHERNLDRQQRSREKGKARTKSRDGSGRLRLRSQVEAIVSLALGSRGSLNPVLYLPDGAGRIIGRFAWKTSVKSRKDSYN